MARRQIIIHIGTHKTATTSVQGLMARAEAQITGHGIFMPKAGRNSRDICSHHNIAWTLRGDPRAQERWGTLDDMCTELSRTRLERALISSEDFEYLVEYPDLLRHMEGRLEAIGWHPTYVLFLRRPGDYLISLCAQLLREGMREDFSVFASKVMRSERYTFSDHWTFHFNYSAFIDKWQRATRGELAAYSYDEACAGPGVLSAFLDVIGIPATPALIGAPPVPPRLDRRLRAFLTGKAMPSAPANVSRLNVNDMPVTAEMRAAGKRATAAFDIPWDRLKPIGTPAIHSVAA